MPKALFIAEKPSVAQEFAKALHEPMTRSDGFLESENAVVTWCVGHLVTMSYPEVYDPALKYWRMETLPFIPEDFRYEIIDSVKKQYETVKKLLHRKDVDRIYVCTDSGREGEYIYRLVEQMAVVKGKKRLRVWIDSQTEEEIRRGIREAKDLSAYDNLAASAYLRAKEDYLMGINFSRLLAIKYGNQISEFLGKKSKLAVGRVMTCVLGMVVRREREIRSFVKTPYYRLILQSPSPNGECTLEAEWRVQEESEHAGKPYLYRENGFLEEAIARGAAEKLMDPRPVTAKLVQLSRKQEKTNPPLLFNLAELQNTCSKTLKISPDETLKIAQELYEKKLVTYPRTDARVLSSAIAREIDKNIRGLTQIGDVSAFARKILEDGSWKKIGKSRYTNDKQITDHYAIIPTGQGLSALAKLPETSRKVYEKIVRRFLAIFYPPAVFRKTELELVVGKEHFFSSLRILTEEGFMAVSGRYASSGKAGSEEEESTGNQALADYLGTLKKGQLLPVSDILVKAGETTPPKRYTSGSLILAMENAGQLIEDEELRAQIKGSGIGTSATRAEILKKLVTNDYLKLSGKTQIMTPTLLGEMIYDTVACSIKPLLNPELTASWEMGLTKVAEGTLSEDAYMEKLKDFITRRVEKVRETDMRSYLGAAYREAAKAYRT
ncbi:MAG: type IA DNA topoisomerase [Lachnospiraceae bacterium]|nr:type IA DNA topoisomerase [Lachnospiraceae bacterium]